MCERADHAIVTAAQVVPEYDRITLILAAVAIIVAALGVMFTAASLVLAFGAIRGWNELLGKAKEAAETAAKDEAKKWADYYSDPAKMFALIGVNPAISAPGISSDIQNEPIGEQLVEAVSEEPQPQREAPPRGESHVRPAETTSEPESEPEPERKPESGPDGGENGP